MHCPHCDQGFSLSRIEQTRGKGLKAEFQCPKCQAWLGKSATLLRLKILGFYTAAGMGVWYYFAPEMQMIAAPIGILAAILLLATHLMDQLLVIERPPETETKLTQESVKVEV